LRKCAHERIRPQGTRTGMGDQPLIERCFAEHAEHAEHLCLYERWKRAFIAWTQCASPKTSETSPPYFLSHWVDSRWGQPRMSSRHLLHRRRQRNPNPCRHCGLFTQISKSPYATGTRSRMNCAGPRRLPKQSTSLTRSMTSMQRSPVCVQIWNRLQPGSISGNFRTTWAIRSSWTKSSMNSSSPSSRS
jgi:hypothetical protein